MSRNRSTASGGTLSMIARLFGPARATVRRPRPTGFEGLNDYLLRDIGQARGAHGRDRLNSGEF